MPQYYSIPDWQKRGKAILKPRPFWRNLPILKQAIPYHVGDKVKFCVQFEKPNQKTGPLSAHVLWEKNGDNWKPLADINTAKTEVVGTRIHSTGDVAYCLGHPMSFDVSETVFTTRVENWDDVFSKWAWAIIGMILSLIIGIILWMLGFIQIIPNWKLLIR